jgi:diketogulonate reductase-like aldo/keto reductase
MTLTLQSTVTLNNGVEMPVLGLGVYEAGAGGECRDAVVHALRHGYRHVDTAAMYRNETDVGEGVRESGVARADVFVVTKLWNSDHGYDKTLRAFDASDRKLGLGYVDQYLIHWPVERLRADSWKALEKLHKDSRARSIGVSNYTVRHLRELLDTCEIPPAVNQVEFHPWLYQKDLLEFCKANGIALVAYSPLCRARSLKDKALVAVAQKHGRTSAQALLRWGLQKGVIVIPKSTRSARIEENAGVFDWSLDETDEATLDALNKNRHVTWDPTDQP